MKPPEIVQRGETDLETLLQNIHPELQKGVYVFCSIDPATVTQLQVTPIGQFLEQEGLTVILEKSDAEAQQLSCSTTFRMITLNIHSSLDAVGFLAVITNKLAAHCISVNAVSAYFHDHLFVPMDRADEAVTVLQNLSGTDACH